MSIRLLKLLPRIRRHRRLRARLMGTPARPRLAVFRSLNHITAQLIDDTVGRTLLASTDQEIKTTVKQSKTDRAQAVGAAVKGYLSARLYSEHPITWPCSSRGGLAHTGYYGEVFHGTSSTYHNKIKILWRGEVL